VFGVFMTNEGFLMQSFRGGKEYVCMYVVLAIVGICYFVNFEEHRKHELTWKLRGYVDVR
jgi:hypothetical protein